MRQTKMNDANPFIICFFHIEIEIINIVIGKEKYFFWILDFFTMSTIFIIETSKERCETTQVVSRSFN